MSRRGFLECMTGAGTALFWTVAGGVRSSRALAQPATGQATPGDFGFVEVSDSHIGFKGDANPRVLATFHEAIAKINRIDSRRAFVLYTGDLSHTQKPGAFDTVTECLMGVKPNRVLVSKRNAVVPFATSSLPKSPNVWRAYVASSSATVSTSHRENRRAVGRMRVARRTELASSWSVGSPCFTSENAADGIRFQSSEKRGGGTILPQSVGGAETLRMRFARAVPASKLLTLSSP
jgi:hypothetical protein